MFKKIFVVMVAICMLMTFIGCGDASLYENPTSVKFANPTAASAAPSETPTETTTPVVYETEAVAHGYGESYGPGECEGCTPIGDEFKPGNHVWCVYRKDEGAPAQAVEFMVLAVFEDTVVVSRHYEYWETTVDGMLDELRTRTSMGMNSFVFAFRYDECYWDESGAIAAANVVNGH